MLLVMKPHDAFLDHDKGWVHTHYDRMRHYEGNHAPRQNVNRAATSSITPHLKSSDCDIYILMLYCCGGNPPNDEIASKIDTFLENIVWRVQTPDEFEPDPSDVHHIGSDKVVLEWHGLHWAIDAFLMLLIDADKVAQKRAFMELYNQPTCEHDDPDIMVKHRAFDRIHENDYTRAILDEDADLCSYAQRQFLKRFLFWMAIDLDTRCERMACKANNILNKLELGWPMPVKVRNVRAALHSILLQYAYGFCSQAEFEMLLRDAYETGFVLPHEPDIAAEEPAEDCLFVPTKTRFEEGPWPWLVLRSTADPSEEEGEGEDV